MIFLIARVNISDYCFALIHLLSYSIAFIHFMCMIIIVFSLICMVYLILYDVQYEIKFIVIYNYLIFLPFRNDCIMLHVGSDSMKK